MNEEDPTRRLVPFRIVFRGTDDAPQFFATPDVLAAIAADWRSHRPTTPLATAVQRDPVMQTYQVFVGSDPKYREQRVLMFRLDDVLYIS